MRPMTMMGVDFGSKRIGIALTTSGVLATPLEVVPNEGGDPAAVERIAAIAREHDVERIVLGNPARTGDESVSNRYRNLAARLSESAGCDVILWDEAYSTTEAASLRKARGKRAAGRSARPIDDEAAAVILQSYLDAAARGAAR